MTAAAAVGAKQSAHVAACAVSGSGGVGRGALVRRA
jgi:hypothetical protein